MNGKGRNTEGVSSGSKQNLHAELQSGYFGLQRETMTALDSQKKKEKKNLQPLLPHCGGKVPKPVSEDELELRVGNGCLFLVKSSIFSLKEIRAICGDERELRVGNGCLFLVKSNIFSLKEIRAISGDERELRASDACLILVNCNILGMKKIRAVSGDVRELRISDDCMFPRNS